MRRFVYCAAALFGLFAAGASIFQPAPLAAATPNPRGEAERLVAEALQCELDGRDAERAALLSRARELDPRNSAARWHAGEVQWRGEWNTPEEFAEQAAEDLRREAYRLRRERTGPSASERAALAAWCRRNGLLEEARVHLFEVLELEPNNTGARTELGFRFIGGRWVSREALEEEARSAEETQQNLATWLPKIAALREQLHAESTHRSEAARKAILAIHETAAIPALEQVLSLDGTDSALLVIEVLTSMTDPAATASLARHAVLAEDQVVRKAAAEELRRRPNDHYVPQLIAELYTPVESRSALFAGPGGRLIYRHAFVREGQEANDLLVLDTSFRRRATPGGDRNDSLARAMFQAMLASTAREQAVDWQNNRAAELNRRITWVLNATQDETLTASPETWWSWWNTSNEVFVAGEKGTQTRYSLAEIAVADRIVSGEGGGSGTGTSRGPPTCDCLAGGTLVWTLTGPQPIQEILAGDMVLAQHPETGELAYKAVLRTTLRPEEELIRIEAGDEQIDTSGGHPFWVAGRGWVKARELQSGEELHTQRGTVRVSQVTTGASEVTYNLIVADFHTYFAGNDRLLSHDNTPRSATSALVPGLKLD